MAIPNLRSHLTLVKLYSQSDHYQRFDRISINTTPIKTSKPKGRKGKDYNYPITVIFGNP